MKIIAYHLGQLPTFEELGNELKAMQEFVGGYIQTVPIGSDIILVCNEEGKIKPNPQSSWALCLKGELCDYLVGDFFICRVDGDEFADAWDIDLIRMGNYILPASNFLRRKYRGIEIIEMKEELKK